MAFGRFLLFFDYVSVLLYVSAAFNFELDKNSLHPPDGLWPIRYKTMRQRLKELLGDRVPNKAMPFTPPVRNWLYPIYSAILALSGVRMIAGENLDSNYSKLKYGNKTVALKLVVIADKGSLPEREIHIPCICKFNSSLCPVHFGGTIRFPIPRQTIAEELKKHNKKLTFHSYRRLHCMAIAKLAAVSPSVMLADPLRKARINAQLGWVGDSNMYKKYTYGYRKLNCSFIAIFKPILRYYMTGKL